MSEQNAVLPSNNTAATDTPASRPTIYDVADQAGVAISTVSRVLNNSNNVASSTREKVLAVIEELQFRPSRTAKSLAQQSTRTIAIAVPTFTTPFHNELLKGVRSRLKNVDIELLLCDLRWAEPEATLRNFLSRGAMDGLLVAGFTLNDTMGRELKQLGAPVVLIGSQWDELDSFHWDETAGVHKAIEHLAEQGHERIGMVTTHREGPVSQTRIRGYEEAMQQASLPVRDEWIATGHTEKHAGFSEESGYEAMQNLLETDPGVTAVFASSDVQAIGAWQAIRHAGKSVPDDIALIGYDDIKISRFIELSSVAQNMHDVGEEATNVLLQRLRRSGTDRTMSKLIHPTLKIRTSTGGE